MKQRKPPLRAATHDRHDGRQRQVCTSCHKLPKFCNCGPDAVPNCPICGRPESEGLHFPQVDNCRV